MASEKDEAQNRRGEFGKELKQLINRYCQENESDTPDFILANYLRDCLSAWNSAVRARENWYGRQRKAGPRHVATASKPNFEDDNSEVDATIRAFAEKAHNIIQKARRKMTPEQRERADRNARTILDAASAATRGR